MSVYQYSRSDSAFTGLAESAATSNVYFTGDATMVCWSLTTSSTTASRWTVQGNASDGFFSAIDASQWQPVDAETAQGYYSLVTIPRWLRIQRTPSNSSSTVYLTISVGP